MPCRRGCSPPRPAPVCCCARRCGGRHRPHTNGEHFCTADTCSNPEFCIKFRPQFCPNAPSDRENPDAESPQFGRWPPPPPPPPPPLPPPPFPDITAPWPPTSPHSHRLSSTLNDHQSHHSTSSLHSLFDPPETGNQQPYSTQSGSSVRRKSTARLSIGQPSLTRLDSGHNGFQTGPGLIRPDSGCPMRQRLASMGRPPITITPLDGTGCCQTDCCSFGGSHRFSNGAGGRYSDPAPRCPVAGGHYSDPAPRYPPRRGSRPQPVGHFQQAQQGNGNGNGSVSDMPSPELPGRCECRMPPAFAGYRCTGNLSGLCDCPHCDDNK